MHPTRRALLGAAVSIGVAGCLGDDEGESDDAQTDETESPTPSPTTAGAESPTESGGETARVQVERHDELGEILVGPDGLTLYMFDRDTQGEGASTCYDDCAAAWPPLTVDGTPTAGDGVVADLETFERDDGAMQVMAGGWPLYYFASDDSPGDANGQGANDVWWVVDAEGVPVRPTETPTETSTASDGGTGGY